MYYPNIHVNSIKSLTLSSTGDTCNVFFPEPPSGYAIHLCTITNYSIVTLVCHSDKFWGAKFAHNDGQTNTQ